MDWNIIFMLLTLILFIGTSIALYRRKDRAEEVLPDHPLLYVIAVQELRQGPSPSASSVPIEIMELDQVVVKKQLYVYGESILESESSGSPSSA